MKEVQSIDDLFDLSDTNSQSATNIPRYSTRFTDERSRSKSSKVIQNELNKFFSTSGSNLFKNFRGKFMKGFINITKSIRNKKTYQKGLGSSSLQPNNKNFEKLEKICRKYTDFENIERTISAPIRKKSSSNTQEDRAAFRSFSNTFINTLSKKPKVLKALNFFFSFIFDGTDPEVLCKEFNFRCCSSDTHELECIQKWNMLKDHLLEQGL